MSAALKGRRMDILSDERWVVVVEVTETDGKRENPFVELVLPNIVYVQGVVLQACSQTISEGFI